MDDDRDSCEYLARIVEELKNPEFEVHKAFSGIEAESALLRENFDIVLSDIGLPDKSGLDIAGNIVLSNPGTRIILISGNEEIIQSINSMDAGIYDFLIKPIEVKKLVETIRKALKEIKAGMKPGPDWKDIIKSPGGRIRMADIENWAEHSTALNKTGILQYSP